MSGGVAGYGQHLKRQAEHVDGFLALQGMAAVRDVFQRRGIHVGILLLQ